MATQNVNETSQGRFLTDEQLLKEDGLIFRDLFQGLQSTCLMTIRSQEILNNSEKKELHMEAERINRRSERCYEELIGFFTDYVQSTFHAPSVLEADPFGKWVYKLSEILAVFLRPLMKRYDRLLQKEGVKDAAEDLASVSDAIYNGESFTVLHLWIVAIIAYIDLSDLGSETSELIWNNMDEKGNLPKELRKLDIVSEDLDEMNEKLLLAMYDYAMTNYELEYPISEKEEEGIVTCLLDILSKIGEDNKSIRQMVEQIGFK